MNPEVSAGLEGVIRKALEKDRELRYQHASDLRADLKRLKRDTDSGRIPSSVRAAAEASAAAAPISASQSSASKADDRVAPAVRRNSYARIIVALVAIAVLGAAIYFWQSRRQSTPTISAANPTTVAVLPFQNVGADQSADFLRLALPDEIATALSYVHSLSIRPFATTSKYTGAGVDLQQIGREMRVSDIVTGHYMKEGDQLQITLEAVDVENNRTLWRDTFNVPAADMITTRAQINDKVRQGLIPALGASTESAETSTRPKNEEAYDLYLRSLALPHDPAPNKEGIAMLERAVGLDPTYAPAWANLGRRYYLDSQYGGGGEAMFQKANTALEQALKLDPNLTLAAAQRIATYSERGELLKAYQDAQALVERQPKNSGAHFALGYMLRYAGLLDESAKACNDAYTLDSGNYLLRACSFTFSQMGDTQHAMQFIALDAGSNFYKGNVVRILLREGKLDQARAALKELPPDDARTKFLAACFARPSTSQPAFSESDHAFREAEDKLEANPDPENRYLAATDMAYCGEKESAVRLLKSAIEGKYCSYDALQKDPLLAPIRSMPEYPQLLSEAKQCRDTFLAERNQAGH